MKNKKVSISQITAFVNSLTDSQREFVESCLRFAKRMREVISEFNVTKETFCKAMDISPLVYDKYIHGAVNYSISEIACFAAFHTSLLIDKRIEESAKEAEPIKFGKYKYSEPLAKNP